LNAQYRNPYSPMRPPSPNASACPPLPRRRSLSAASGSPKTRLNAREETIADRNRRIAEREAAELAARQAAEAAAREAERQAREEAQARRLAEPDEEGSGRSRRAGGNPCRTPSGKEEEKSDVRAGNRRPSFGKTRASRRATQRNRRTERANASSWSVRSFFWVSMAARCWHSSWVPTKRTRPSTVTA